MLFHSVSSQDNISMICSYMFWPHMDNRIYSFEILSGVVENSILVSYDPIMLSKQFPTFWKTIVPSSSHTSSSNVSGNDHPVMQHHITEQNPQITISLTDVINKVRCCSANCKIGTSDWLLHNDNCHLAELSASNHSLRSLLYKRGMVQDKKSPMKMRTRFYS